ncbi:coiled-coil domain-containing protein 157-like isoform X2 [Frankliniella occidentalis]|uniref:Coiled-coil domain-containing protein 157-like isoform X2 n=1 Tax=Frankliniella occidentalis TaxID=133901 RepID=A0A9C6TX12_FRAOC|nr:coiled-coil domain-containing protein 157-like isoform X2 [Frankliniella occidentalis]
MDLQDLRAFIASQKARLEEERCALRRRSPLPPSEQEKRQQDLPPFPRNNDGAWNNTNHNNNVIDSLQIQDVLCERIANLSNFRDQVCLQPNVDQKDPTSECSPPLQNESVQVSVAEEKENNQVFLHPQPKISSDVVGSREVESCLKSSDPLKIVVDDNSVKETRKEVGIQKKQYFPAALSREQEVERLQEKFSSAPFWEGFGSSATTKKWSPNPTDRMVRIGEFSPSNPDLQAPGKALLGLGEYEDRRRQLLEKKKQEYKEYLSQNRNTLQKTDHLQHPSTKSFDQPTPQIILTTDNLNGSVNSVDAATQTESWLAEQFHKESSSSHAEHNHVAQSADTLMQPLSPREKHNMELRHHCAPCFVSLAHASQTTEQLPDARMRQLQLQEELRLQIEEKRKLEAERRAQERKEEEALQKRVAEQQARLQAEFERDEKLRRDREIQKQQQIEEFQRRQEELKAESEALKQEGRRQKLHASEINSQAPFSVEIPVGAKNAHLVPPAEPAPVSILKSTSPPLRSPRRAAHGSQYPDEGPPSPRALIKVLEGPTLPLHLEDSLPIPLMPVVHSNSQSLSSQRSPHRSRHVSPSRSPRHSPHHSPHRSPHRAPRRSPSRFIPEQNWNVPVAPHHHPSTRGPSDAMRNLEERWKVPAVQKNVCVRGKTNVQNGGGSNVLTQLGAFRRQLQIEHMRMEEKVKEKHHPQHYNQQYYQQHIAKRNRQEY